MLNLVLDEVEEVMLGMMSSPSLNDLLTRLVDPQPRIRKIGLAVLRGPQVTIISPVDGSEEIDNPFASEE